MTRKVSSGLGHLRCKLRCEVQAGKLLRQKIPGRPAQERRQQILQVSKELLSQTKEQGNIILVDKPDYLFLCLYRKQIGVTEKY